MNSCAAIEWAITDGNTTKTGKYPDGLGLKLIKDFIRANNGKMQVVSGDGYNQLSATGVDIFAMENNFPGTCVNLEINTEDPNSYCLKSELDSEDIF